MDEVSHFFEGKRWCVSCGLCGQGRRGTYALITRRVTHGWARWSWGNSVDLYSAPRIWANQNSGLSSIPQFLQANTGKKVWVWSEFQPSRYIITTREYLPKSLDAVSIFSWNIFIKIIQWVIPGSRVLLEIPMIAQLHKSTVFYRTQYCIHKNLPSWAKWWVKKRIFKHV